LGNNQEKHHFMHAGYTYEPLSAVKERDKAKNDLAAAKGITLISIPFWWDGKMERYQSTKIKQIQL